MAAHSIPGGPEELTPEWLTHALRNTGTIRAASVTSFDAETIGEGTGLLGQLARITLHYDRPEGDAPRTLVAKFPAAAEENRQAGMLFRFYERENRFYEEIAGDVEVATPRCFYSAMDPEAGQHVLLLEDLSEARLGDQLTGSSRQEAELVVREAAKMHARWWESPRLAELGWIPLPTDSVVTEPVDSSYNDAWEPFLRIFGDRLSPEILQIGERLRSRLVTMLKEFDGPPRTLVHGDYRLDNMFFGSQDADALTVADWQICIRSRGTYDTGYFMSQSVPPEQRRASEMDILRTYHETLLENGATGYGFDQCLEDYRRTVLFCLVYPVISGGTYDLSNRRAMELVGTMLERCVSAITDLNAGELLPA
jgi:hypothetical protein